MDSLSTPALVADVGSTVYELAVEATALYFTVLCDETFHLLRVDPSLL